jgi:hypothetical protein
VIARKRGFIFHYLKKYIAVWWFRPSSYLGDKAQEVQGSRTVLGKI